VAHRNLAINIGVNAFTASNSKPSLSRRRRGHGLLNNAPGLGTIIIGGGGGAIENRWSNQSPLAAKSENQ
jgi:hypothetical protein